MDAVPVDVSVVFAASGLSYAETQPDVAGDLPQILEALPVAYLTQEHHPGQRPDCLQEYLGRMGFEFFAMHLLELMEFFEHLPGDFKHTDQPAGQPFLECFPGLLCPPRTDDVVSVKRSSLHVASARFSFVAAALERFPQPDVDSVLLQLLGGQPVHRIRAFVSANIPIEQIHQRRGIQRIVFCPRPSPSAFGLMI